MRMLRWTALALTGALAFMAVVPAAAQSVDLKPTQKVKRDKYVLTAEEIAERPGIINAYDAVKLLRPQFLKTNWAKGAMGSSAEGGGFQPRPSADLTPPSRDGSTGGSSDPAKPVYTAGRSAGSGTDPDRFSSEGKTTGSAVLYINEIKQYSLEDLKTIRVADVLEIRYLNSGQAAGRFGPGHESGAILLKTILPGKG
jgi:hypothetical protein